MYPWVISDDDVIMARKAPSRFTRNLRSISIYPRIDMEYTAHIITSSSRTIHIQLMMRRPSFSFFIM
jgi:hypothetical protein